MRISTAAFLAAFLFVSFGCDTLTSVEPATSTSDGTVLSKKSGPKYDEDGNGFPDEGVVVGGNYTSLFAYEGEYGSGAYPQENWYWDLGDGRIYGTVGSVDDLDQDRLTVCDYVVNYRGAFENDAFQDSGWIQNHIKCSGYDDDNQYNYIIVHESDARYRGNPDWAVWTTWEYHILTISGFGNLVRPLNHAGG